VLFASRVRVLQGLLIFATSCSLAACRKDPPPAQKPKPEAVAAAPKKSPEEIKQLADAARKSLDGLKQLLAGLNTTFSDLHRQFDTLPPDLPDFGPTRGKFYSADEGLGRMNTKVPLVAAEIDAAVKAGDGAELEEISKSIANTYGDVPEVEKVAVELMHEVLPFQRLYERYAAQRKAQCEATSKIDTAAVAKKLSAH